MELIKEYNYFYFDQIDDLIETSQQRIELELNKKIITNDFEIQVVGSNHAPAADEVLRLLTEAARGQMQEEQIVSTMEGVQKHKKEIAPKDRLKAIELLAKRYGLSKEQLEYVK